MQKDRVQAYEDKSIIRTTYGGIFYLNNNTKQKFKNFSHLTAVFLISTHKA